ncbi:MAG: hypothetical protein WAZ14_04315 [Patescibacteria group bacterium]
MSTWIRIAGNVRRIKTLGDPMHWRCYINRQLPEVELCSFEISGPASPNNFMPGTDPSSQNELGLTAWFDVFGDITIGDDRIAHIVLKLL